jgi:cytochrome b subunit of formate dehydrogenase
MDNDRLNGWTVFAALVMLLVGGFNMVQGLVALFAPERLFITSEKMVVLDFDRWGWVLLIWGAVLVAASWGLSVNAPWARVFAITVAMLNALGQLTWIGVQPYLSLLIIALDIGIIWGLTAGQTRYDDTASTA